MRADDFECEVCGRRWPRQNWQNLPSFIGRHIKVCRDIAVIAKNHGINLKEARLVLERTKRRKQPVEATADLERRG